MKIPPLNPLRVFECVARTLSFTRAADELHVTTGAVSRQIRALEEYLDVQLFVRGNREVRLTELGEQYRDELQGVFERIAVATNRVVSARRGAPLQIWCQMTFAMRWLLPRMYTFHAAHPDQDVVFTTTLKQPTSLDDADVAIRIGDGAWPGQVSHRLVPIELLPVCSPRLLENGPPLTEPKCLEHHTLLQSAARPDYWRLWLAAQGVGHIDPDRGLTFENVALAYQAAMQGLGVAMGQFALVADDLNAGNLVAPFDERVVVDSAFYLSYPERLADSPRLREFRDWILAEAGAPVSST